MKSKFILILSISALMPTYSHAHDDIVWMVERTAEQKNQEAQQAEDEAKRSARNFLGYEKIFTGMKFGDPVEKLGADRKCNPVSLADDASGDDNQTLACTLDRDYGKIEDIPIYDVEYDFQKTGNSYQMTGVNIGLYKSNDDLYIEFYGTAPGKAEKTQILSSAAKVSYVVNERCLSVTTNLDHVWGRADIQKPVPEWFDNNNGIKASLAGVACNILTMESSRSKSSDAR